jgi:hypothetical protein
MPTVTVKANRSASRVRCVRVGARRASASDSSLYPVWTLAEAAGQRDDLGMRAEPSRERLLEQVRVSFYDEVLGMTCMECSALEIVRVEPSQFDDEVRRFLRTHPGACSNLEPGRPRRLVAVPSTP